MNRHVSPKPTTVDEWMGVYNLASMWSFDSVSPSSLLSQKSGIRIPHTNLSFLSRVPQIQEESARALRGHMQTRSGLESIHLGRKHDVGPWIERGIYLLIEQEKPLDLKELKEGGLSAETICSIYSFRERAFDLMENCPGQAYYTRDMWGNHISQTTPNRHFARHDRGMKEGAHAIFLSYFSEYSMLGKETLDVDWRPPPVPIVPTQYPYDGGDESD